MEAHATLARSLVASAHFAAAQGWLPATSGNLSARLGDGRFLVTESGVDKRQLTVEQLLVVDGAGRALDGRRPSAETRLHLDRYAADPGVGAVLHTHAPSAVVASRLFREAVVLEGLELLKAFHGVTTHRARVVIPIVDNDQDLDALSPLVSRALAEAGHPPAFLVRGHGVYAWGRDVGESARHAEALDALLRITLQEARYR
jgi:methylthioribulose-1-phosphate dehydratase